MIKGDGDGASAGADAGSPDALYIDADWIAAGTNQPMHGFATSHGRIFPLGLPQHAVPLGRRDYDASAAAILVGYAARVFATVAGRSSIEIAGRGATAAIVRCLVDATTGSPRPDAVVVLSSDPDEIRSGLARLADLGTLVLACPANTGGPLNLYEHVHRRGLRIVGVPEPSVDEGSRVGSDDERLVDEALRMLRPVSSLERAAPHSGWYRVGAGDPDH